MARSKLVVWWYAGSESYRMVVPGMVLYIDPKTTSLAPRQLVCERSRVSPKFGVNQFIHE